MNKLLALTLLAFVLVAVAGAEESREAGEAEVSEAREVRAVDKKEAKKSEKNGVKKTAKKGGKKANKKDGKAAAKGGKKDAKKGGKKAGKKGGKKAGKKGGKKAKKGGKKAGKKGGKTAAKKGGKKAGKKAGKSVKKGGRKEGRQSTGCLATTCLDTAVSYLALLQTKGATLNAQANRITKLNGSGTTKGKKVNNFNGVFGLLVDSAGGNASAPKCGSASTGAGAQKIANLTAGLAACPTSIAAACTLPDVPPVVTNCSTTIARFSANVNKCLNLTINPTGDGAATCTCWADTALTNDVATVKSCNLITQVNSFLNVSTTCTAAVAACNKLQASVTSAMQACNQDPSALTSKLKSLTNNRNDATKVATKISALTGAKGLGHGLKVVKRAPSTTCTGVAADAKLYSSTLSDNPAATNLPTLASNVYDAGAVTCSDADKATLSTAAATVSAQIESINLQITTVQSSLEVLTGTTASAAVIAAAASCSNINCNPSAQLAAAATTPSTATKAPAGRRRRRVVEDILRAKLM